MTDNASDEVDGPPNHMWRIKRQRVVPNQWSNEVGYFNNQRPPIRTIPFRRQRPYDISAALIALFVLPLGISVAGLPLAMSHVVFVPALLLIMSRSLYQINQLALLAGLGLLSITTTGLFVATDSSLYPILTLGHFLSPYIVVPLFRVTHDIERTALYLIRIFYSFSFLTAFTSLAAGRMTQEISINGNPARSYSIATYSNFLAGGAQVNTWSVYLLAGALTTLFIRPPYQNKIEGVVARTSVLTSIACVSLSGSRANTLLALIIAIIIVFRISKSSFARHLRHRIVLRVALLSICAIASVTLLPAIGSNPRLASSISGVANGNSGSEFRGRSDTLVVMISDIRRSPVVGTGFRDFTLWHSDKEIATWSPHNQWVGAIHKMGVPAAEGYALFLGRTAMRTRTARTQDRYYLLAGIFIAGLLYDVLTSNPSGAAIMTLLSILTVHRPWNDRSRFAPTTKRYPKLGAPNAQHQGNSRLRRS